MEKITDFRPLIVKMVSVKSDLQAVDKNEVFPNRLPAVAASEEQISAAEQEMQVRLDDEHRAFLGFADGWSTFSHNGDLFSLDEIKSVRQQLVDASGDNDDEDEDDEEESYDVSQLLPIAAAEETGDIFVMPIRDNQALSEVIWMGGGEEVDRFETFGQFFASMIAYSEQLVESVRKGEFQ